MTVTPPARRRGQLKRGAPIEKIIELWRADWTLEQIGAEIGVSRQRVSQRLIEAGFNPAERHARTRQHSATTTESYRQKRAQSIARRAEQRAAACRQLEALAETLGVSPYTLGHYAAQTGTYARRTTGAGNRAGTGRLPVRTSSAGEAIAASAKRATEPYSVQHIGQLCSRRS